MLASLPRSGWIALDAVVIGAGIHLGYRWFVTYPAIAELVIHRWSATVVFAVAVAVSGLIFGLHERDTLPSRSRILTRVLLTAGLTCVLAYACIYVVMYGGLSRRVAGCALGTYLVLGVGLRLFACWATHTVQRSLLILGNADLYRSFQQSFREGLLADFRLVGYVNAFDETDDDSGSRLGRPDDLLDICRKHDVADVVISTRAARRPDVMQWILPCLRLGCRVTNEEVYYEKATGQILVDRITPNWFLFADINAHCQEKATLKRLFDVVVAGAALALSLSLWPLIALAIKLDDGGPVFHTQDRVGQNGKVFRLFKFRTMIVGAENGRSVWARPNDPRITRVGRLLRRTRLDELPQLCNILIGSMSVVGPRPERPSIVLELTQKLPYYEMRHLVKPGLTGWAQISFRYGSSVEDAKRKLQFDLHYLKHMSIELDVVVLFRTLGTFLRGAC